MDDTTSSDNLTTADPEIIDDGGTNYYGIIGVIAFYLVILGLGLYASWRSKQFKREADSEDLMLAGRDIGPLVGIFTMTATWVGGGYINGTAEIVYTPGYGLVWAQAPVGYALSLLLGGILFARKMREAGYVTMLDPFAIRYGQVMAGFLYIPALLGESFWCAAILSALGASLSVILHLDHTIAIIVSAAFTLIYTSIGGLYSVSFTDVIQLFCITIGLWLGVGFSLGNDAVAPLSETMSSNTTWLGSLQAEPYIGLWIDSALLLIFGGIPWQAYFQRVLASKTPATAQILSACAAFGCIIMAIPAVLIGAIGASADWSQTSYPGEVPLSPDQYSLILPLVLQYLTPTWVAVIGLGAVSAAVMSSADSSILSASSMFAHNIYRPIRNGCCTRNKASEREIVWMVRLAVVLVGVAATVMAIVVQSIYGLWYLCSDLVYCLLFPQLLLVVYTKISNTYGSAFGFTTGVILRFLGGEPLLNLSPVIVYPWYDPVSQYQNFPYKTLIMLISLISIYGMSIITHLLFTRGVLPPSADIFKCFEDERGTEKASHEFTEELHIKNHYGSTEGGIDNVAAVRNSTVSLSTRL